MELTRQRKIAYGIIAALAVIFLALLAYLQVLQRAPAAVPPPRPRALEGLDPAVAAQQFAVEVLADPHFQSFDRSLLDAGRLPVPVPGTKGKPNLF